MASNDAAFISEAGRKLDASRRLYRWTLPSDRPANRVQKAEMSNFFTFPQTLKPGSRKSFVHGSGRSIRGSLVLRIDQVKEVVSGAPLFVCAPLQGISLLSRSGIT
jgi:hypothetical protein